MYVSGCVLRWLSTYVTFILGGGYMYHVTRPTKQHPIPISLRRCNKKAPVSSRQSQWISRVCYA